MLAFINNFLLFFAASSGHGESSGFSAIWEKYLSYPGFEVWKFVNLFIFVGILIYILKKPLSEQFKAKRNAIKADLIKAEEEKQAALAELASVETKIANLDSEKDAIMTLARDEVSTETARLLNQAVNEVAKIKEMSGGEILRLTKLRKLELARFSAEESLRLAEEKLKAAIDQSTDERLVETGIKAIGGTK